jgi:hypothetical protein
MKNDNNSWTTFTDKASILFTNLRHKEISLEEVFQFINYSKKVIDDLKLQQDFENIISEVDGFPIQFDKLCNLLMNRPSRTDIENFFGADIDSN